MEEIFADTGYLIAIQKESDFLHRRAIELSNELFGYEKIVTSDLVVIETLNYFSGYGALARESAFTLLSQFSMDPGIEIVCFNADLFIGAGRLYRTAFDRSWSFTDCSSFVIMRERGMRDALTYDHHFQQAGFWALMREDS
jgi:predicted nucleic acid-binding protein